MSRKGRKNEKETNGEKARCEMEERRGRWRNSKKLSGRGKQMRGADRAE